MLPLEYSRKRLRAFVDEMEYLKQGSFPYRHSEEALDQISMRFHQHLEYLDSLSAESDLSMVQTACRSGLAGLFVYLPVVGFILRSTDVRNAFEIHGPLLRLAEGLLGRGVKLIVSSEWDYSPVSYCGIPLLPGFSLIGLPAPEAANPLLVPLAGHELGHPVWASGNYYTAFAQSIEDMILGQIASRWDDYQDLHWKVEQTELRTDLFARQTWEPSCVWALLQAEETFCDFVALRIFREAYLHAFAYLVSPGQEGQRPALYPKLEQRVANLVEASDRYGVVVPEEYESLFTGSRTVAAQDKVRTFLISLADAATRSLVPSLIDEVDRTIQRAGIEGPDESKTHEIYKGFVLRAVPPRHPGSLSNIINAGWQAFHDEALWENLPEIEFKDRTLKELVLKSIEILDIEQKLGGD